MRRAVFLDRDGVLNRIVVRPDIGVGSPRSLDELEITPGAMDALMQLRHAGFLLICVTNQPELAQGKLDRAVLEAMHDRLRRELPLDDLLMCPHDDAAGCECRKPKPGLLTAAAAKHGIDLPTSFMVGDRWRDVEASKAAGCVTVFLDGGYEERRPAVEPDAVVRSLQEAAEWILLQ